MSAISASPFRFDIEGAECTFRVWFMSSSIITRPIFFQVLMPDFFTKPLILVRLRCCVAMLKYCAAMILVAAFLCDVTLSNIT